MEFLFLIILVCVCFVLCYKDYDKPTIIYDKDKNPIMKISPKGGISLTEEEIARRKPFRDEARKQAKEIVNRSK